MFDDTAVLGSTAMLFRDWWRIETPYGYVELELDESGGALTDEVELDETENVLDVLTYGIENRDPRITEAIVAVYVQAHPEQFPPGLALSSLSTRDIDPMRPTLIRYLEQQVAAGNIRLYEDDVVITEIDVLEPLKYTPQPVVEEKLTFIGFKVFDQDDEPVRNSRVRVKLPDGDVKEGRTNSIGEVMIKDFALDGMAKIELLDFVDAIPSDAAEEEEEPKPEEKEITVEAVDDTGTPLVDIVMVFDANGTKKTVRTDSDGIAKYKVAADSVNVSVENAEAITKAMAKSRPATPAARTTNTSSTD